MPLLDGWTNVNENSPSTRIGSQEGDYVLVGPNDKNDYSGNGRTVIQMDSDSVWIIGRVFSNGTEEDLAYIKNELYPDLTLTPWSKRNDSNYNAPQGLAFDPMAGGFPSPIHEVYEMSIISFFSKLAAMMNYNPAIVPQDKMMIQVLSRIGFNIGSNTVSFDSNLFNKKDLLSAKAAKELLGAPSDNPPINTTAETNWWNFASKVSTGDFGREYYYRASIARWALGANLVEDCIYGYSVLDSEGNVLSGANNYKLHFPTLPPVSEKAFWSVTIYNADGTLVNNEAANNIGVNYNAIGIPFVQAHEGLLNPDGSMTLYLQASPPKNQTQLQNWIPTPQEGGPRGFIVFLRMYMPDLLPQPVDGNYVVKGNWIPPGIEKQN